MTNDRVKAYRERQKAAGLTQVSLWLDATTVRLLKQAAATHQRLPGEVVATALQEWHVRQEQSPTPPPDTKPAAEPAMLRQWVQQWVQEALVASGENSGTALRPSANTVQESEPPEDLPSATEAALAESVEELSSATEEALAERVEEEPSVPAEVLAEIMEEEVSISIPEELCPETPLEEAPAGHDPSHHHEEAKEEEPPATEEREVEQTPVGQTEEPVATEMLETTPHEETLPRPSLYKWPTPL
ncbi:MAG: hypothetical protein H7837_08480 [Magnetococcus sp. MYC-9]